MRFRIFKETELHQDVPHVLSHHLLFIIFGLVTLNKGHPKNRGFDIRWCNEIDIIHYT